MLFPEIPEMLETHVYIKLNFQPYRKIKMSRIIVLWSNREIKMPRNIVFRLTREIKISRNSELLKKTVELRCGESFIPPKFLTLK